MINFPCGSTLIFPYEDYRGETTQRVVIFKNLQFGSNEWYPEPQWFLHAFDLEKNAYRSFALARLDPSTILIK